MTIALRRFVAAIISASLVIMSASAQSKYNKYDNSYHFQKALELLGDNEYGKAESALIEEVKEHPNNGYAYLWLGIIQNQKEEYGKALSSSNNAIKLIPKKDKEYYAFAFHNRARVYEQIDSIKLAITDYSTAISIDPEDDDSYERRAQIYYQEEQYDLADKDYHSLLKLDENSVMAQMGLGRNELAREKYASALKYFDKIASLYSDYSSGFSFRAESYIGLKKYKEAASDIVTALDINMDNKAFYLMQNLADSSFVHINTKLKAQAALSPNEGYWSYCLGVINEQTKRYSDAITNYQKSNKLNESDVTYNRISKCYQLLGEWDAAIENIDKAIDLDPAYYRYLLYKSDILYDAGLLEDAILVLDKYIDYRPDYHFGYYRRGWYKDNNKDIDGAIEDYTTSIELEPDYAYAYMGRARQYELKAMKDLAQKDYEKVIQIDPIAIQGSCTMYALHYLGQDIDAIEWMSKMLDSSDDEGIRYDAACLYSLMGVTFGGLELTNVRASVVANDKAPLLLGQSALNRLGKIEIDYDRSVLKITSKIRKSNH